MIVVHSARYFADIGAHVMPMRKFGLVRDAIAATGLPVQFVEPAPATDEQLLHVHTPAYVRAVATGEPRALAESQKFPWSPALADAVRWTNGGCVEALRLALRDRAVVGNLASGFHHAHADHGEGFCTFNGLVVALEVVRTERGALRALVLDMDLHYGNGTASLLATRPWISQLSIYGNYYERNTAIRDVGLRRTEDTANCRSIPVPAGTGGAAYLDTLRAFDRLLDEVNPDVVVYQAGADPYREDPYSPLDLGHDDLYDRDERVFTTCRDRGLPVMWVLAGGYTADVDKVVQVHCGTFRAATGSGPRTTSAR